MAKKTPSFTADDFIATIAVNASNIAASEAARGRSQEPSQADTSQPEQGRVGESTPTAQQQPAGSTPSGLPANNNTSSSENYAQNPSENIHDQEPTLTADPNAPDPATPCKNLLGFIPYEVDAILSMHCSRERTTKKRIVLEAVLDYLHRNQRLTDDEYAYWLKLPKEWGAPKKGS